MNPSPMHDLYRQIDEDINSLLNVNLGFTALLRPSPCPMGPDALQGFTKRFSVIRRFQQQTLALFKASLRGDADPSLAQLVLGDVPSHLGLDYHRQLSDAQHQLPVFFRTDEPLPGKLSEIQCPGSAWCLTEQLHTLYRHNPASFGSPAHFHEPLPSTFAQSLTRHLGSAPIIHHLADNASLPHGARYFIQRTRQHGLRYFSYDRDVTAADCNFVRSHDFISLPHHNYFSERMARCNEGALAFDLSPSALFDTKLILAWPFSTTTRNHYDDEIRALFPFTSVIRPDGVALPDGQHVPLQSLPLLPRSRRNFFLKYAGTDIARNWGSRAVFHAGTLSQPQFHSLLATIETDLQHARPWIAQDAMMRRQPTRMLSRQGSVVDLEAHPKFSAFYGPGGLMGILVLEKQAHKVHGSKHTIMSIVY